MLAYLLFCSFQFHLADTILPKTNITDSLIRVFVAPANYDITGGKDFSKKKIARSYIKAHRTSKLKITQENISNYIVDASIYDYKREFPPGTVLDIDKKVNYRYVDLTDKLPLKDVVNYTIETDRYMNTTNSQCSFNPYSMNLLIKYKIDYVLAIRYIEFSTETEMRPDMGISMGTMGVSPSVEIGSARGDPSIIVYYILYDRFGNPLKEDKQSFSLPDYNYSNIFRFTLGAVHKINSDIYNYINSKKRK